MSVLFSPIALLISVHILYKTVERPGTIPIVLLMVNGSHFSCRRRLTIFEPDKKNHVAFYRALFMRQITVEVHGIKIAEIRGIFEAQKSIKS